ncbi:hypothetical protein BGX27_007434 [Mortierella sp. AM989]|nr:hypothetical protein BGX27_007434 [Mortierella sp. AM989]
MTQTDRASNGNANGTPMGMPFIPGHKGMVNDLGSTNEWTSFLAAESFSDTADSDMEQLLQGNVNEENWGPNGRNNFSLPNPSSFMERAERQQKREIHGENQQEQERQIQQQLLQQQEQQQQMRQQQLYQLQQQQMLRIQLELASQTQLPQSPAPGIGYHTHMPHHYVSGLSQFASGHSPANSPLSPGNYAGEDYFSSRQVSPGPAASPGGTSKIKSRPRPSTAGTRISQGGIKALFGQTLPKANRASLDLKTESALQMNAVGAKTSLLKKKPQKSLSAEIPQVSNQVLSAAMGTAEASRSIPGTPTSEAPPAMTLAERRAAAAALNGSDLANSSQRPDLAQPKQGTLIPPNLGLDSQAKQAILPPNLTPGAETMPLPSPSLLSASASSPAPIQIGRIIPRNSSSHARTEEQQKLLDDAMERVDFEDVTVAELKEMLRQRGKHGGGKKADLIKRLQSEIELIRSNRNPANRTNAPTSPMPIGSSANSLHRTLGNMHIGSPPIHSNMSSSPSARRYTPYTAPLPSPGATGHPLGAPILVSQGPAGSLNNTATGTGAGAGATPAMNMGHPGNHSRSISGQNGRDANSHPVGSPRMTSLLGSSFISSDGTVYQNPVHPHNQRHQSPASASVGKLSPNSSHASPAGSSLRNSLSPESNPIEDIESEADILGRYSQNGVDHAMDSEVLCNELLTNPDMINSQAFPLDASFLASVNGGATMRHDMFALQVPVDTLSVASPSPTLSSSSVATPVQRNFPQQSQLSQQLDYRGHNHEATSSISLMYDDACVPHRPNSADIKQAEEGSV